MAVLLQRVVILRTYDVRINDAAGISVDSEFQLVGENGKRESS